MSERALRRALAAVLVLGTLALYRVGAHEFVAYDDDTYVTANEVVQDGLTLDGLRWALTTGHGSNWHPLTWLSHMLDVELFGLDAGAHHRTSAALHALNAALAFAFLVVATGRTGPAFLAAALFAWHPLRVESVAWVAERKDLLAGAFFLGTLLAWVSWTRASGPGSARRYLLVCVLLALGLCAKPMLVTTPFVLLLIDAWPLGRLSRATVRRRLWEKLPLFALVVASSSATLLAQRAGGAVVSSAALPLDVRALNALSSLGTYLAQTVRPVGLACYYPHAHASAEDAVAALLGPALGSLLALAVLVVLAVRLRRRAPALGVGLAWFAGMLVPVVGLVQVGTQAHADRYTYLPSLGLALAVVFAVDALAGPRARRVAGALALLALALLAPVTLRQVAVWRDSQTLFEHALSVTERNHVAHANLGYALLAAGEHARAAQHLDASLALAEFDPAVLKNLGLARLELGQHDAARRAYRRYLEHRPADWTVHSQLGQLAVAAGDLPAVREHFAAAVRHGSSWPEDHLNLGLACLELGDPAAAEAAFRAGLRLAPQDRDLAAGLARARAAGGGGR